MGKWHADHMCDAGIDDVVDSLKKAIAETVSNFWASVEQEPVEELVQFLDENLDEAFEHVVSEVDAHIDEKLSEKDAAWDAGFEAGTESVYHDDTFIERDEHDRIVDDLEAKLEEAETVINVDGLDYTWIPEKGVFVSRIGRVLKPVETEDCSVSANMAW